MTEPVDPQAPHGRDEHGVPLAPFGLNLDGTPRKSNRGARPGQKGNSSGKSAPKGMKAPTSSRNDAARKTALLQMVDALVVVPLVGASVAPMIVKQVGEKQAVAMAADAYDIHQHMPAIADGLVVLSQTKPGVLSWLDSAEENAPYLALMVAGVQLGMAIVGNHRGEPLEKAQVAREFVLGAQKAEAESDAAQDAFQAELRVREAAQAAQEAGGRPIQPEGPQAPADDFQAAQSLFVGS